MRDVRFHCMENETNIINVQDYITRTYVLIYPYLQYTEFFTFELFLAYFLCVKSKTFLKNTITRLFVSRNFIHFTLLIFRSLRCSHTVCFQTPRLNKILKRSNGERTDNERYFNLIVSHKR